jgi:sugar phosphate isomerase/epimerase
MIKLCAFADEANGSLQGQIEALKRNGIAYLELRNVNGKNVSAITLEEAKEYAEILKENGIKVYSLGSPVGKVDIGIDFDKYLEDITHIFRLANIFETKRIRMFSFFNAYDQGEKVISYLKRMVEKAKEYGVELYHENEKDIYGDIADRVEEILNAVPDLKSVYDPANYLQVGEIAENTLNRFHARTDYFHIKDVISSTGELVPAGYGDGNIQELVRRIKGDKVLSIEPHLAIFEGYAQIDNTEMKHKFEFHSNDEAFDAAVSGIKEVLAKAGYKQVEGGYEKA